MQLRGRLFDLYPLESSMILWIKGEERRLRRFEDPFRPRFYARGKESDLLDLFRFLQKGRRVAGYQWNRKKDLWSGDEVEVMEIEVVDSEHYAQLPRILPQWEEKMTFYNCDIPLSQSYLYGKKIFPTGRCIIEVEGNRIFEIHPDPSESVWINNEDISDLQVMELRMDGDSIRKKSLVLECEGYRVEMETIDVGEIEKFLKHFDPDVILSDDGDAFLLPLLFSAEKRWKISIPWDREPYPVKRQIHPKGFSYFSYGRTYYRAPAHLFLGRWHIDRRNSFIYGESGMEGVIELARLAKIPVQRMARTSPGTAITSMQLDRAFQDNILIPWRKGEPERFKTAWDLLVADKGGLVFQPKLGIFEDVAEIDFASMYPTMMAIHNISPETVLCGCCENHRVPEVGYTICEKREGIVPKTLRPILTRRAWLKRMAKEAEGRMNKFGVVSSEFGELDNRQQAKDVRQSDKTKREIYNRKQKALKWMLVTCFGYLGYRNARFGRIEAHEAVTAFGRESLLQAKEICEEEGFELLHAITDSLWIHKKGFNEEEILDLCRKISEATGMTMSLEGIYQWMAFLPSKGNPESPVANRYFGLFQNGKIKARGLAFRRGDTPPLIREAQVRMIEVLAGTKNIEDFQSKIPEILDLLLEYSLKLKDGQAKQEDLAIGKRISREPNAYKMDSLTALAAQELEDVGIPIHPGEKVRYVIKDALSKNRAERVRAFPLVGPDDIYDVKKYLEMLVKATEEILIHFGYNAKRLKKMIDASFSPSLDACLPKPQCKQREE
jgi:DNA polymerase elongation subunit (family B)